MRFSMSRDLEEEVVRRKVVVVGDGFCGKTSLLFAFLRDEFVETYVPTVCETFIKAIEVNGRKVELVLWDTAGQEDYDRLRPVSYNQTSAVIVCFSVDDPASYDNVQTKWAREVRHFCPDVPIILVATKLDLRYDMVGKYGARDLIGRLVTSADGSRMARHVNATEYVECSAKTKEGVLRVFETVAKETLKLENVARKRQACSIC